MKIRTLLLVALLLASFAFAEDISFTVDGQPLGDTLDLKTGETKNAELTIAKGVKVVSVDVESENAFYEHLLESMFSRDFVRSGETQTIPIDLAVDMTLPKGTSKTKVVLNYETIDFEKKQIEYNTNIVVDEGSAFLNFMLGLVPGQVALELLGALGVIDLPRLSPELLNSDLTKEDFSALGLSPAEVFSDNPVVLSVEKLGSKQTTMSLSEKVAELATYKKHVKGKLTPTVQITVNSYKLSHDGKELIKSKILVSVPATESTSKVKTIAIIPKSVAQDVSELSFSEDVTVIEADPIIKWDFGNVPAGQAKDYAVTVDGDASDAEIIAVSAGKKPSWLTRLILMFMGK